MALPARLTHRAIRATAGTGLRAVLGLWAVLIVIVGAGPMALAQASATASPIIAQEFRAAGQLLGGRAHDVVLVAIVANPVYRSVTYTRAFDRQEGLAAVPNWLFLTGSLSQLQHAWGSYGVTAQIVQAGGMAAHTDVAYVIDRTGRTRSELNFDPGPGTASSQSSFAAELAASAQHVLGQA